jgi:hypothetical protein
MVNPTLQTNLSSKASVTELDSVETSLKNQIDSKSSEMDLQTLKVRGSFSIFKEFKLMVNPIFCRLMSVARLLSQNFIPWKQT